jgi:hypothetical protein
MGSLRSQISRDYDAIRAEVRDRDEALKKVPRGEPMPADLREMHPDIPADALEHLMDFDSAKDALGILVLAARLIKGATDRRLTALSALQQPEEKPKAERPPSTAMRDFAFRALRVYERFPGAKAGRTEGGPTVRFLRECFEIMALPPFPKDHTLRGWVGQYRKASTSGYGGLPS